jgi:hypothetical protein
MTGLTIYSYNPNVALSQPGAARENPRAASLVSIPKKKKGKPFAVGELSHSTIPVIESAAAAAREHILSRIMATSTEPEGAPPAAKGPKGEANTKGSNEHGEVGAGSGGGSQKRKRKEVFIYGNYRNYYGYRVSATASISAPPLWN